MTAIELFFLLQLLDFLTTLVGLRLGGSEISPMARWLMEFHLVAGLVGVKLIGFALGAYCVWAGRLRVIGWANYYFAALVVWNVSQLLKL
jgi:hypothetical protein